jgi:type VI secretion system VasD/TssJ family lipoprotein
VRKYHTLLVLLFMSLLVYACATEPINKPVTEWSFEPGAIRLDIKADAGLNFYDGSPHTIVLWCYQLSNPNKFNQLAEDRSGLSKLLEGGQFDPSVADFKREILQPGKQVTLSLDRAEGAKYLALAAGYYFLNRENAVRLLQIPTVEETRGKVLISRPERIAVEVYLGMQSIQKVDIKTMESQKPGRKQ